MIVRHPLALAILLLIAAAPGFVLAGTGSVSTKDAMKVFSAVCEASAPSFAKAPELAKAAGLKEDGKSFVSPSAPISMFFGKDKSGHHSCGMTFTTRDRQPQVISRISSLPNLSVSQSGGMALLYHKNPAITAVLSGPDKGAWTLFYMGQ